MNEATTLLMDFLKPLGVGGSLVGVAFAVALWLRTYLSRSGSDVAEDRANVDVIQRLQVLLDAERIRAKDLEARADQFAKERNDAIAAIGELKAALGRLESTVNHQSDEIARLRAKLESGECSLP